MDKQNSLWRCLSPHRSYFGNTELSASDKPMSDDEAELLSRSLIPRAELETG